MATTGPAPKRGVGFLPPPDFKGQSIAVRLGRRIRDPINGWLSKQSLIGDDPLVDPSELPGLVELGRHWRTIRDELLPLLAERQKIPAFRDISPDHRRIATDSKWKSFFLEGYGFRAEENCARCPRTMALLKKVPGLVVAFFSIMEPGTQVPPHRGVTKAWYNCHLGLVVPEGKVGIEIAGWPVGWREGEWLVFDETNMHRVWNETDEDRVVLFLQVRRPMTWRGKLAAKALFKMIRHSSFVQDVRRSLSAR
ncbi:MAG TPA: aspartyl/asparaginyl beta-hydroxylase domain-containing protein [Croceibacterium sp.]|jgi:beta-hydroxylase|nr:aspartyl/asparaginyl beta-hydroxylase domain-containing protein [Croceibacterium sp.]